MFVLFNRGYGKEKVCGWPPFLADWGKKGTVKREQEINKGRERGREREQEIPITIEILGRIFWTLFLFLCSHSHPQLPHSIVNYFSNLTGVSLDAEVCGKWYNMVATVVVYSMYFACLLLTAHPPTVHLPSYPPISPLATFFLIYLPTYPPLSPNSFLFDFIFTLILNKWPHTRTRACTRFPKLAIEYTYAQIYTYMHTYVHIYLLTYIHMHAQ